MDELEPSVPAFSPVRSIDVDHDIRVVSVRVTQPVSVDVPGAADESEDRGAVEIDAPVEPPGVPYVAPVVEVETRPAPPGSPAV